MKSRPRIERRSAAAGFTLVELMVAIVIIGLMAGIVSVSWERILPGAQLNADVRGLSNRLHGARSESISRSAIFRIFYDLDNEEYWMLTPYDEEGRLQSRPYDPSEPSDEQGRVEAFRTALRAGIEFVEVTIDGEVYSDGVVQVRFDPLGASNDHSVVLHQDKPQREYTVEVLGLTGLIRFHDGIFRREVPDDSDFK